MAGTLKLPENYQKLQQVARTTSDPFAFTRMVQAFESGRRKPLIVELMGLGGPLTAKYLLLALNEGLISCDDALEVIK